MECPHCDTNLYGVIKVESILVYTDENGTPTNELVESVKDLIRDCEWEVVCTECGYQPHRKHIRMLGGRIVEDDDPPDLTTDFCGLPEGVSEEEAKKRMSGLYVLARLAYNGGRMREAEMFLYRMSSASGHFGLGAAKNEYRRLKP